MNAIDIRGATKKFGSFTAVDHVDLQVAPGSIVGLLGANGAGKTTLMKMLLGLHTPDEGRIRLFGSAPRTEQRRRIGYVPQNLGLYTDLTASENLEFRAAVFDSEPAATAETLTVAEIPLGTQRRLAFDAATQHQPDVLVLDEPTSGVSPLARSRLWDVIHTEADRGVAVLVSTHYMDEAEQADELVIMSRGARVAAGLQATITAGRSVIEVATDEWADAFTALDDGHRLLTLKRRTLRVLNGDPADISTTLGAHGIQANIQHRPATLEEVLIELDQSLPAQPATEGDSP